MAFTGYLLSWDQSAYSAGSVGTDIVGQVPIIGDRLRLLLRGGAMMGALTLSRFYVLHVFIIPALIFSFIAVHIVLFRKAGAAGPVSEDPVRPRLPAETFYPKQVLIDMGFVLLVMGVLGMLAHFVPVTLGLEANPTNTRYLPRPEWYFLPMFQWLKYWEGWRTVIGVFIIPVILIGLLFLLPFMDRGLERRPWRRPIPVGGVFIVLIGLLWLGMTSRLVDSRDPTVAAQLAEQNRQEDVVFLYRFSAVFGIVAFRGRCVNFARCNRRAREGHFRFSRLQWMPRRERRRRRWASADSYFQQVSASSIDSTSEGADCQDESWRHGATDFEWCRNERSGFLPGQPRGNIGRLCGDTSRFRVVLACARQCGTRCGSRVGESNNWKFGRQCNRHPGEGHFRFSAL